MESPKHDRYIFNHMALYESHSLIQTEFWVWLLCMSRNCILWGFLSTHWSLTQFRLNLIIRSHLPSPWQQQQASPVLVCLCHFFKASHPFLQPVPVYIFVRVRRGDGSLSNKLLEGLMTAELSIIYLLLGILSFWSRFTGNSHHT